MVSTQLASVCLFVIFVDLQNGHHMAFTQFISEEESAEEHFTLTSCCDCGTSIIDCKAIELDEFPTWPDDDKISNVSQTVDLYLNFNKISKVAQIRNSSEIAKIYFNRNLVSKIDPYAFANLPNLKTLGLSHNRLAKIDPNAFKSQISSHLPLQSLDLSYNIISRLPPKVFDDLANLKHLNLVGNKISQLPSSGLHSLNTLVALETLNLSRNELSDLPASLKTTVTRVHTLDLSRNTLKMVPEVLQHGKGIRTLILSQNHRITEFHALSFRGLENLKELEINKMDNLMVIRNGTFTHLKSLEYLYCSGNRKLNKMEGNSFANVSGGHANLQQIDLRNNNISSLDVGMFKHLSFCEIDLTKNPLKCSCDVISLLEENIRIENKLLNYSKKNTKCHFYPENGSGQTFIEMNITDIDAFCIYKEPASYELFWGTLVIFLCFFIICLALVLTRRVLKSKFRRKEVATTQLQMVGQCTRDSSGENFDGNICTKYANVT